MWIFFLFFHFQLTPCPSSSKLVKPSAFPPPNEKITLSEKNIISLQEKTNSILIQAQSKGQLTLTQGSSQKHIYVVENKEGWQLFRKISKDPWLRLEFSQNKIQIQGQLYRFKTWKYLSFLSQKHSIPYLFKAQIPIEIQNQAHEYFKKQINQSFEIQWNSPVTVQIPSNFEKEYLFSSFGFSITQDKNIITLLPLVEIKILVTQVTENLSKNIALHPEFAPESSEPITTPQPKTFNLNSLTQLAEKIAEFYRGSARGDIISSSQTIVESGQTIDYLFGGEVPVHQTHLETLSTSIDWKPYGLRLKLSPTVHQKNSSL